MSTYEIIESNLLDIINEISRQPEVGKLFPSNRLTFDAYVAQLLEYVEDAGEYGVAYESIVACISRYPFSFSGKSAVKLLEVGLLMRYKTGLPEDKEFDSRPGK
jgi:hypothetical protein